MFKNKNNNVQIEAVNETSNSTIQLANYTRAKVDISNVVSFIYTYDNK